MNGSRFDDISRRMALAGDRVGSRRGLIKAGVGAGLAATVGVPDLCAAAPATGDGTSRPVRRQTSPDDLLVQQIAFDLDYDVDKIFRFVADEIAYESYDGALRGVRGTIWSGAGNSVDQAQLLHALLTEALVEVRFAFGALPEADAATLLAAMAAEQTPSETLRTAREANRSAESDQAPSAPQATPTADQPGAQEVIDRVTLLRDELFADASTALDNDVTRLTGLLSDAGIALATTERVLAQLEVAQHAWVQIREGSEWADLDPSFGADTPVAPPIPAQTLPQLPDELFHRVTFRVIADVVSGETITEKVMLDYTAMSQDLVGEDLLISHIEPEFLTGIGVSINEALAGQIAYYPMIMLGQDGYLADSMVTFGSGGGVLGDDALGGGTGISDGECLAERYEVTVTSPKAAPATSSRVLFDRVPAAQRAAAKLVLAEIPPVKEVDLGNGEMGLLEVNQVIAMAAVVSSVDAAYLGRPLGEDEAISSFTGAIHGLHALRESLEAVQRDRPATFLDRTNVTAYAVRPMPTSGGASVAVRLDADLLHQGYGFRADGNAAGIYAGVLAQKAERLALDRRLLDELYDIGAIPSLPQQRIPDVQSVFEEADAQSIPIVVLTPDDAGSLASLGVGDAVAERLGSALGLGKVVVIPAGPVTIDGAETTAWWLVDPSTGAAVDQLPDGRSGAAIMIGPMLDNAILSIRTTLKAHKGYIALGVCLAAICRGAAAFIQQRHGGGGGAFLNVLGNFEGALFTCAAAAAAA